MKNWYLLSLFFLLSIGSSFAQNRSIKGIVVDELGEPLIGAAVAVKGSTIGTITDVDGKFTLSVPQNVKNLTFTLVGFESQDVPVATDMRVSMKTSSTQLAEVVVNGMQTIDKRLFTGASSKLVGENVKIDGMPEISRGLEGRASGVSVQNVSGTFGTAPKIRVRGATSIYGSSKPLWVVDGIIMEDVIDVDTDDLSSGNATTLISSVIAGLNADDIESFDILKDGSATSIYGARAMAGVIVITTKKGKAGQSRISYTGEFTMRLKPSYSDFNIMNSQEQMDVYQEMQRKGWLTYADVANRSESGVYGKMNQLIASGQLLNTEASRNAYLREAEYRNTDWFGLLFRNNLTQNHSVSVTSGTEKSSYYASLSAMVDPGWSEQSKVNRYTASLNATYNISKSLALNVISNATFRKQRAPGTLGSTIEPVYGSINRDFDINPYSYAMNTSRVLDPNEFYTRNYAPFNILSELENNYMDVNVADLKFQGELRWKPVKGLEAAILGAAKYSTSSQEHHITDFSNQALAYRAMPTTVIRDSNPYLYSDPDNAYAVPITVLPNGGIYERSDFNMLSYDFRGQLDYKTIINEDHLIQMIGAMETSSLTRHDTWFRGWGLQYSMGEIPQYAYEVFKKGQEEKSNYYTLNNTRTRSVAFLWNGTYSYKMKYTLNGTIRYEGTNQMGRTTSARWLPTWNISGAWNAHEEKFFESLKPALSFLTLKASYSMVADRPAGVTNSRVVINSYTPWRPNTGDQETGADISWLENPELTYEKKHELNLGAALGFLDNRINVEFDWYKRNNYDLIGAVTTPGWGGQIVKYGNVADMKSHGVELSLSTRNIVTDDFKWTTDFIYTHAVNKVTSLENQSRVMDLVSGSGFALEGYSVRSIFSIPFRGLNEDGLPTFLDQDGNVSVTDVYFQERDKEKIKFLEYSGTADPTDFGSFGNTFSYKNLKLNVFLTYSFGNVVRLPRVFSNTYSDLTSMPREFKNRWVVPGDENITNVPTIASYRENRDISMLRVAYNSYNYSTERIAKGDFIRMKEVSLSYDFPATLTKALSLSNLSLKLQATNLFLLYADKKLNGQDPEFFNTGGVAIPVPRQFTLTLRLGL
ncbi:MAG: SusC/RagA family TonB-linked outer membrane protein [Prevotella sp.]|jgi:TonB-linked SusC/RagA family outer membrane protein|nr:SusC/RagA family TonB-linked outer membrane protein [Prevotella sp.]